MTLFDDKASCVVKIDRSLLLPTIDSHEDVTLKASFVATSDFRCGGKVTALFDLIVMGDFEADELEVKGRFVCHGTCVVNKTMIVHGDILAETVQADSIVCHDRIVAQTLEVSTVSADGKILLGKTLSVEEKAQTPQIIMCGETAYGAGRVSARTVITAEEIDLDDGVDALESPFSYSAKKSSSNQFDKVVLHYRELGDYAGLLGKLLATPDEQKKSVLSKFLSTLQMIDQKYPKQIHTLRDFSVLIWLLKITNTEYFRGWENITTWTQSVKKHFDDLVHGKFPGDEEPTPAKDLQTGNIVLHSTYGRGQVQAINITNAIGRTSKMATIKFEEHGTKNFPLPGSLQFFMLLKKTGELEGGDIKSFLSVSIDSYLEWLDALKTIERYRDYLGKDLHDFIYELLLAKLGIKPRFVEERFKDKGWN